MANLRAARIARTAPLLALAGCAAFGVFIGCSDYAEETSAEGSRDDAATSEGGGGSGSDASGAMDAGAMDTGVTTDAGDGSTFHPIPTSQNVVTLGERPGTDQHGVTTDTVLHAAVLERDFNYGKLSVLGADSDPGAETVTLLRFDLRAIPTTRVVTSATLTLATTPDEGCNLNSKASIFRVLEDWDEGTSTGGPGAANFSERKPGVPWLGIGATGSSIGTNPAQTMSFPALDSEFDATLTELVAIWVSSPDTNHGILIKVPPGGDGVCLYSSDSIARPERRPRLEVTLAPVD